MGKLTGKGKHNKSKKSFIHKYDIKSSNHEKENSVNDLGHQVPQRNSSKSSRFRKQNIEDGDAERSSGNLYKVQK